MPRVIDAFVEKLVMAELGFERALAAETGRPGYDPRDLLKLYLYGYLKQIRSSRRLEAECRRNVELMWLLGRLYPDHKSIAEFRRVHREAVTTAGAELVRFAKCCGLIRGEWIAIDGSKFRAVASIDTVRERLALQRYLDSVDKADEEPQTNIDQSAGVDDFTLPWLPRKSRADEDRAFRDEPTAAHVVAGASPERASTGDARFRIEGEAVTMGPPLVVAAIVAVLSAAPRGSSKVSPRDGLTYQWIPPGSYFTGCLPGDTECYGLEPHREKIVVARGFWIGRTEVAQAAYMRIMNADPSYYKGADLPADRVGWTDATTYCSRIGMRLPTESEWEYAAYGGTAELPKEPLASLAWYDPNSRDTTHPVATKLPNGYGLWDMLGNVWEWVQDVGRGPGEHILKGGSFYNIARDVRISGRLSAPPDLRHRDIGFRCASSAWPEEKSSVGSTTHQ